MDNTVVYSNRKSDRTFTSLSRVPGQRQSTRLTSKHRCSPADDGFSSVDPLLQRQHRLVEVLPHGYLRNTRRYHIEKGLISVRYEIPGTGVPVVYRPTFAYVIEKGLPVVCSDSNGQRPKNTGLVMLRS